MKFCVGLAVALLAAGCGATTHSDYMDAAKGNDVRLAAQEFLSEVGGGLDDELLQLGTFDCLLDRECVEGVERMLMDLCDRVSGVPESDLEDIVWDLVEQEYPSLSKRDVDPIAEVLTFTGQVLADDSHWARDDSYNWCNPGEGDTSS